MSKVIVRTCKACGCSAAWVEGSASAGYCGACAERADLIEKVALLKAEYAQLNELVADWAAARMRERQIDMELEALLPTMTEAEKAAAGVRYLELMREYWAR